MVLLSESTERTIRRLLADSGLLTFWRWWSGELLAVAPPWLRAFFRPAQAGLALQVEEAECCLHNMVDETWTEIARWPTKNSSNAELPAAAAAALVGRERLALVVLARQDVLRRRIEVPAALAENLREAIGYELDRYTPYKVDQVYFDARVLARDDPKQQVSVDLGVVPKERAERALGIVTGLGFAAAGLLAELPEGTARSLDFLAPERRPRVGSANLWRTLLPVAVVIVLALVALSLPIALKRAQVRALEPLVNEARTRAEAAEVLHRQLLAQQDEHNFLLAKKHGQPMAIEVLDEATRILPDDTWVHLLELKSDVKNPTKNQELQVRGETGISGKLISVFEESKLFTQATYKSPVTKGQPGAGDMFHVAAEVKKRSLQEAGDAAVPIASAPAVAPTTQLVAPLTQSAASPPSPTAGAAAASPPQPSPTQAAEALAPPASSGVVVPPPPRSTP